MKRARVAFRGEIYRVDVLDDMQVRLPNGLILAEQEVQWLPPSHGVMYALGLNYADHANELTFTAPQNPLIFIKTPHSYIGHRQQSWRPDHVNFMHYEGELVAVIAKIARHVKQENALEYIAGYTVCNDYTIRDYLENYYRPNLVVKNRQALTPIGPYIIDKASVPAVNQLNIKTWVNGELRQQGNTADMIFKLPYLIAYLSSFLTLHVGDMIATGTPKGLFNVTVGDEVVVEIDGIGRLVNHIIAEQDFIHQQYQHRV